MKPSMSHRRLLHVWLMVAPLALAPVVTGCIKAQDGKTAEQAAGAASGSSAASVPYENLEAATFSNPTTINNPWLPLTPGMRYVYEGITVEDDGTVLPHRVIINVTDLTKVVGGVRSVVTWDLDYADGELAEAELAFYAQDDEGNVWRMGEYPEEYSDGKFVTAPTWIHGRQEARAGIMMKAQPAMGTPSYAQGWGPAVDWTDRGQVDQVDAQVAVKAGSYTNVLVIAETAASEPDAAQLKFYARDVGNVKVGWRGAGEKSKETLDLVAIERLDAAKMAEVRAGALKLEAHAYQVSPEVYAHTPPLETPAGGAAGSAGAAGNR